MNLRTFDGNYLPQVMSWFGNEAELKIWSGPDFRYPFTLNSFKHDLKLDSLASYMLFDDNDQLLAFGQFYLRSGKCHLGRLVVDPNQRGQGLINILMQKLCDIGRQQLQVAECSLFVLADNDNAIQAYKKFGFIETDYPDTIPMDNCYYMVLR